jgi:hypothetical protein
MDFAIVAEGYTDQVVLKHILLGFFGDAGEEPLINFEQPLLDTTSQRAEYSPGGWDLVIKYFQQGKYKQPEPPRLPRDPHAEKHPAHGCRVDSAPLANFLRRELAESRVARRTWFMLRRGGHIT